MIFCFHPSISRYGHKHRDYYAYLSANNPSKVSRNARETLSPVEYEAPPPDGEYEAGSNYTVGYGGF